MLTIGIDSASCRAALAAAEAFPQVYAAVGRHPKAARRVPEDRMLIETDAPYLSPQPVRRQRNQPAYVAHTLAFLAAARGQAPAQLDAAVERNAARVFGWG